MERPNNISLWGKQTKGYEQDSQNRIQLSMPEENEP